MRRFVMMLVGIIGIAVAVIQANEKDADAWCRYLVESAEPNLLIYNRIPKCGSSSMIQILSQLDRAKSLHLKNTDRTLWGDYGENSTKLHELKHAITASMHADTPANTTVAVGHITYSTFEKIDRYFGTVEYMQIFRQCESRFVSNWLYTYNSSIAASHYRARGELDSYHQQQLGTPNVTACITDPSCLRESPRTESMPRDIIDNYLATNRCHGECSPSERFHRLKSQANLAPGPSSYVTFGVVEHWMEYIEMLECAYPNAFAGVLHVGGNVTANVNHWTVPSSIKSALQQVASEICEGSSDPLMYNEFIVPVFWSRYRAMKNKPESCCRRRT